MANGQERFVSWGLAELSAIMGEAWHQLLQIQQEKDLVLHASISNQLLAFRPDREGQLQRVDTIEAPWTTQHPLLPPFRAIRPATARARLDGARDWPQGSPPEPDWSRLDRLGNYLHQLADVPDREEAELDLRFDELQLSPHQLSMAASPEARLKTLQPVRHGVAAQMESRRRIARRVARPNKWARQLGQRYKLNFAQSA